MAVFLLWFGAEPSRARPAAGLLVVVGVALTAWTLVQCVPLPVWLLARVAPSSADLWARALTPLGEQGPSFATISFDPIATRVQVLRGVAYLLAFLGAVRIAQRREGAAFLQMALVGCGVVLAVTGLIHPAFGADKLFWLYKPSGAGNLDTNHLAPLLNANHFAGYVNIACCLALAAAISQRSPVPRPILFATFLMLFGVELWLTSRGGMVGFVVGITVVIVMSRAARMRAHPKRSDAMLVGLVLTAGLGMIVIASFDEVWVGLADSDMSKLSLAREGLRLVPTSPWLGVGRGAFETAFPAVRTTPGYIVFTHPENIVVQWVTEWGVPVALAGAAAVAYALRPGSALVRSDPPVGAWAALAAVAVHNLVDFNMEVPGVVIPLAVCAGVITGGSGGVDTQSILRGWAGRPNAVAMGAGLVAASAIALVIPGLSHELLQDRLALRERALDVDAPAAVFRADARRAMLRHPGEPYLPFMGALRAARRKDESVIPWIERTLERAPVYGPAHLVLAQSLYSRSPSQARLEYRLALEQDPSLHRHFQAEIEPLIHSFDDASQLVPAAGPMRAVALTTLVEKLPEKLPASSERLDEALAKESPADPLPTRRAAQSALADVRNEDAAPWCAADRKACIAQALRATAALREKIADRCEGYLLHAQVLIAQGDAKAGLDELDQASNHVQDWVTCTRAIVDAARASNDDVRVNAALARLTRAGCGTDEECRDNLLYVAAIEIDRGNSRRALAVYRQAYERVPSDDLLLTAAALASRIGLHAEALKDFIKLAEKNPGDARFPPLIAAEREAVGRAAGASARPASLPR